MPKKYTFAQDGNESSCESDGGTIYRPKSHLGIGTFAQAARFTSKDSSRSIVVLSPVTKKVSGIDFKEAKVKLRFFKAQYPNKQSYLTKKETDYRIVLPEIPGISYFKLYSNNVEYTPLQQLNFCGSVIAAFKRLHLAGLVFLDFHANNIHYDRKTCQSYFVDGGLSVPIGSGLDPLVFQGQDEKTTSIKFPQIAPECWTDVGVKQIATTKMDVYSFGVTMLSMFSQSETDILAPLLRCCSEKLPENRPTIDNIEAELYRLAKIYFLEHYIYMRLGHLAPEQKGRDLAILLELPASLITDLNLKPSDNADDIMRHLETLVTSSSELINTQGVRLSFIAAHLGYPKILARLKAMGVSLAEKYHGKTLVQTAIEEGNLLLLQTLADLGLSLTCADKDGFTPIFAAVAHGHTLIVEELVKRGIDIHVLDAGGYSLMHWAAQAGHVAMIDLLIEYKLDPGLPSKKGATPLSLAFFLNYHRVVAKLLHHKVSLNKPIVEGKTLVEWVVTDGNLAMAKIFRDSGVDFNQPFPCGNYPVCLAAQKRHLSLIKLFDTYGINLNVVGAFNETALFLATKNKDIKLITYLLQRIEVMKPLKTSPEVLRSIVGKSLPILSMMNKFISDTQKQGKPLWLSPMDFAKIIGFEKDFNELVKEHFHALIPSESGILAKPSKMCEAESSHVKLQEEEDTSQEASASCCPSFHSNRFG